MRCSDWSSDVCSSDLSDAAGQCRQREPEMIGVHGKPGPAPIEPWLQGIAVHPMLAHKIREGELRIRRDLHAHQRPARPYRDQCRQERDLQRSEEHTSALQSLMRISYTVFSLTKQN